MCTAIPINAAWDENDRLDLPLGVFSFRAFKVLEGKQTTRATETRHHLQEIAKCWRWEKRQEKLGRLYINDG